MSIPQLLGTVPGTQELLNQYLSRGEWMKCFEIKTDFGLRIGKSSSSEMEPEGPVGFHSVRNGVSGRRTSELAPGQ